MCDEKKHTGFPMYCLECGLELCSDCVNWTKIEGGSWPACPECGNMCDDNMSRVKDNEDDD